MLSNQLRRQDDEIKALVAKTEASERLDKEHQAKIKEHERKYADLEAKVCSLHQGLVMFYFKRFCFIYR